MDDQRRAEAAVVVAAAAEGRWVPAGGRASDAHDGKVLGLAGRPQPLQRPSQCSRLAPWTLAAVAAAVVAVVAARADVAQFVRTGRAARGRRAYAPAAVPPASVEPASRREDGR